MCEIMYNATPKKNGKPFVINEIRSSIHTERRERDWQRKM